MRLDLRSETRLLGERQLERLLHQALRVWREMAFTVQGTDEFYDPLTAYGCRVDGDQVRFPQGVIDKVLERIAQERQRAPERAAAPVQEVQLFTHGQALQICDLETNALRPATTADLEGWCHAVDALDGVERSHPTFIPTDAPRGCADLYTFCTILLHSRRPHRVSVYSASMLPFFVQACAVAKGSLDAVRRDPVFAHKCWVTSPFKLTRENVDIALAARRLLGVPVTFGQMPVAGASTPITVAGALVQNTAESLALCAMRLAIDDLTHPITSTSTILDMKDASHRQSGPDLWLHVTAGADMQAFLYGDRPGIGLFGTAAPVVCAQSLHEKAMAAGWGIAAGSRSLGIGCLAYSDVGSPVQLVLDYEMGQAFRHLFREVAVDDARAGVETILDTAPRGAYYLQGEHTARFFREEAWLPAFLDHRVPGAWGRGGADVIEGARTRARALFAGADNQSPLSDAQKSEIRALLAEANKAADLA